MHNKCHKIYLSGPFGIFCLYVILTISYLRAQTIETSSLTTDFSRPLFEQIDIFPSILTVYLNCKYCPQYTRELLGCLLGISPDNVTDYKSRTKWCNILCRSWQLKNLFTPKTRERDNGKPRVAKILFSAI